jgi:hypothetical protein
VGVTSKNAVTIEQLNITCRQVEELIDAGMTLNLAIRNLELFANVYAKMRVVGNSSPDHADQYETWSKAARKAKKDNPTLPYGQYLRVEHGTPRRQFARYVLEAFKKQRLTQEWMNKLCNKQWKVAVITHEEDKRLTKLGRTKMFQNPELRWAAAKIEF